MATGWAARAGCGSIRGCSTVAPVLSALAGTRTRAEGPTGEDVLASGIAGTYGGMPFNQALSTATAPGE